MSPPESKAQQLLSRLETLKTLATPEQLHALQAALPEETAALLKNPPLPISWIPARHWPNVVTAAHKVVFAGDDARVQAWGRTSMLRDLSSIFRMFLKLASPHFIGRRASGLWGQYNRNHGSVTSSEVDINALDVTYDGITEARPAFWTFQTGVVIAAIEASGVKDVTARINAGGGTHHHATIRVTWR